MTHKSRREDSDRPFLATAKEHEGLRILAMIIAKAVINEVRSRQGEKRDGPAEEGGPGCLAVRQGKEMRAMRATWFLQGKYHKPKGVGADLRIEPEGFRWRLSGMQFVTWVGLEFYLGG